MMYCDNQDPRHNTTVWPKTPKELDRYCGKAQHIASQCNISFLNISSQLYTITNGQLYDASAIDTLDFYSL